MRVLVLPLLLLVLGAARAIPEDMCVFLLATPGSGSTTMLELFKDYSPCEMSGENSGAFGSLAEFDARLALTDVSQTYSKLLASVWHVSYDGVADNGCFTHDLHERNNLGFCLKVIWKVDGWKINPSTRLSAVRQHAPSDVPVRRQVERVCI